MKNLILIALIGLTTLSFGQTRAITGKAVLTDRCTWSEREGVYNVIGSTYIEITYTVVDDKMFIYDEGSGKTTRYWVLKYGKNDWGASMLTLQNFNGGKQTTFTISHDGQVSINEGIGMLVGQLHDY
jgi:hypothetical protein